MSVSPLQKQAIERTGQDVCLTAGPGSGKTRVLVERFRWLVEEKGLSPLRVLAITFTEKAATEIKERLAKAFEGRPELRSGIERAYVSTIHGFCARMLRENAIMAGLDPEFSVIDETQSQTLVEDAAREALDKLFDEKPAEMRRLLESIAVSTYPDGRQPDLAQSLVHTYEAMRIAGRSVEDAGKARNREDWAAEFAGLLAELDRTVAGARAKTDAQRRRIGQLSQWLACGRALNGAPLAVEHFRLLESFECDLRGLKAGEPFTEAIRNIRDERIPALKGILAGEYYAPLHVLLAEALRSLDLLYRQRKRKLAALDFSDLEEKAIELLRSNEAARSVIAANFDQILMDELQDTNRLQWTLLGLIRRPDRFFAVGDINQSIYGFRHADPEVFLEYRYGIKARGQKTDELYENHRSRPDILSAAASIFGGVEGIEPHTLEAKKTFAGKAEPSVEVIVASAENSEDGSRIEAEWVARRICELAGSLVIEDDKVMRAARFTDFAVLGRSANALAPVGQALRKFGVPYLAAGGKAFFEAREVRDLMHLVAVIANPRDEIAMAGVLRSPLVGASDEALMRLKQAGNLGDGLEALYRLAERTRFDPVDFERLVRFREELAQMRAERDDVSPDRALIRALDASGYEQGLDRRARANVEKFLALVRNSFSESRATAASLVRDLRRLRESRGESDAPPDDSSNAVRLMSIHQAKGLQFPVVFVVGLHRGVSKGSPPILLAPDGALGVSWQNPAPEGGPIKDRAHSEASRLVETREAQEANRLLYVAVTRAQEHLVLSFASSRSTRSPWPEMVNRWLDIEPRVAGNACVIHRPMCGTPAVRLLRVNEPPALIEAPPEEAAQPEEAVILNRPAVSDQQDSSASVTDLLAFAECPHRYYLERYIGWPVEFAKRLRISEDAEEAGESGEPDALEVGREVHALLAGEAADGASATAKELARRFTNSDLGRRAALASRVEREFDFAMALEDIVLAGKIDLWFEEGGELVLVDYKTDDVAAEAAGGRAESYAIQLQIYALALQRLTGRLPDRACLCLLRPGVTVNVDLGAAALEKAAELVREFRHAQSNLRFDPKEGERCLWCPFAGRLCPAGRKDVIEGGRTSFFQGPS